MAVRWCFFAAVGSQFPRLQRPTLGAVVVPVGVGVCVWWCFGYCLGRLTVAAAVSAAAAGRAVAGVRVLFFVCCSREQRRLYDPCGLRRRNWRTKPRVLRGAE